MTALLNQLFIWAYWQGAKAYYQAVEFVLCLDDIAKLELYGKQ